MNTEDAMVMMHYTCKTTTVGMAMMIMTLRNTVMSCALHTAEAPVLGPAVRSSRGQWDKA